MMNQMLYTALTANGGSFADNALEAMNVTVVGMVTIFAVLALLWGIIELLHRVLNAGRDLASDARADGGASAAQTAQASAAPAAPAAPAGEDGALIAAITAAVAAAMAEEGCTGGFRVVAFRRVSGRGNGRH